MYESIEDLEKQVQEFHDNILHSNQLIIDIKNLSEAAKTQQRIFEMSSHEIIREVKSSITEAVESMNSIRLSVTRDVSYAIQSTTGAVDSMKTNGQEIIKRIADELNAAISRINHNTETFFQDMLIANETAISKAIEKLENTQTEYMNQLKLTQSTLTNAHNTLLIKQNEYLDKIQSTKIDQVFSQHQEFKKTIDSKIVLVIALLGITLLISMISLFL